jgi:hypothetical protein
MSFDLKRTQALEIMARTGVWRSSYEPPAFSSHTRSTRLGRPRQQVGKLIRVLLFYRQNGLEQVAGGGSSVPR